MLPVDATNRAIVRAQGAASRFFLSTDNRRIFLAVGLVGFLTLAVKLAAMVREVLVAAKLGTGDAAEAYIAAWVIPGFVSLLISDVITSCLLPLHASARAERDDTAADRVYAEILLLGVGLLGASTVVLALIPRFLLSILASNFGPEKLALAERLWLIMLPAVFLGGLSTIWSSILNAENRFGLAAASPIAAPILSGLGLVLAPHHAVDALAIGFVGGYLVQVTVLAREMRRHRLRLIPAWFGGLPETRGLGRQFFSLAANNVVFNGLPLVDTAMAATLGNHQLAILSYGGRIVLPILSIIGIALGTVVFPYFSRLVAQKDWRGLQRALSGYFRLILITAVPLAIVLILLSGETVRLLFQRGEFTAADTTAVSRVQAAFALMIPCYTLALVYSRVLGSLRKSQLMLLVSIIVFFVNLIGDYLFKELIGIEGIALATVVNYTIQATVIVLLCRRLLDERIEDEGRGDHPPHSRPGGDAGNDDLRGPLNGNWRRLVSSPEERLRGGG
jgi:putative peptidoglycan lipid II flippase